MKRAKISVHYAHVIYTPHTPIKANFIYIIFPTAHWVGFKVPTIYVLSQKKEYHNFSSENCHFTAVKIRLVLKALFFLILGLRIFFSKLKVGGGKKIKITNNLYRDVSVMKPEPSIKKNLPGIQMLKMQSQQLCQNPE